MLETYLVVQEKSTLELQVTVNRKLEQGCSCVGGIVIYEDSTLSLNRLCFTQSMVFSLREFRKCFNDLQGHVILDTLVEEFNDLKIPLKYKHYFKRCFITEETDSITSPPKLIISAGRFVHANDLPDLHLLVNIAEGLRHRLAINS